MCYNCDDYGSQLMKTFSQCSNFDFGVFISVSHIILENKALKCLTLHVMSLYNILVSLFNLNY